MSKALGIVRKFYPTVTSVKDSRGAITVMVTKRDCQSKAAKSPSECALARACKRDLGLDGVIIAIRTAYLVKGRTAIRCGVAENTSREIVAFDRNGDFAPGEYELIKPFTKLGSKASHGRRVSTAKRNTKPRKRRQTTKDIRRIGSAG